MPERRSALIVAINEAEQSVAAPRRRLDPLAPLGVPAHVTVLFPFMPAAEITDDVRARLSTLFAQVPEFTCRFARTAWFGTDTLWLAPEPPDPFAFLTSRAHAAFPAYPPYEGRFAEVVPHLTIADHAPLDDMRAADQEIQRHLPITATISTVTLLTENPSGHWDAAASFPLSS